jgi:hypothetical protein
MAVNLFVEFRKGFWKMSVSVINFNAAKQALQTKKDIDKSAVAREKTKDFAFQINNLVAEYSIDPVHQATLLMAKAIDVLVTAGPVPANIDEQHARAKNLLHSVMSARSNLLEKSVRIVSPSAINYKMAGDEFGL